MSIEIPFGLNGPFIIDEDFKEEFDSCRWHCSKGYLYRSDGRALHRIVISAQKGEIVDHINGDIKDNRKSNLRIVTSYQSSLNRRRPSNNTSGYKGVFVDKKRGSFKARIFAEGIEYYLGTFDSSEEAAHAYNKAAKKLHGEFASLNQI